MTISATVIDASAAPKPAQVNTTSAKEMAEWDAVVTGLVVGKAIKVTVPNPTEKMQNPGRSMTLRLRKAIDRLNIDGCKVFDGKDGFAYAVRSNGTKSS